VSRFPSRVLVPVALGVVLFVVLGATQQLGATDGLDAAVLCWLYEQRHPQLTRVMRAATALGDGWVLTAITLAAAALLWQPRRAAATYLLCAGAGIGALSPLLKALFHRARPDVALRLAAAGNYSFPSGHSLGSAAVYGALALVVAVCFPRLRLPALLTCVALVCVIGLSRLYLHVHYPSDVLAGWALGGVWAGALGRWMLRSERPNGVRT
jgi:undecaprenyl-diphosphatase